MRTACTMVYLYIVIPGSEKIVFYPQTYSRDPISCLSPPGWSISATLLLSLRLPVRNMSPQPCTGACEADGARPFNRGVCEVLAHLVRSLYVGLPGCRSTTKSSTLYFIAGSLSLLLTMSGVSSEGIAPTCGRSGFVT